MKPEFMRRAFLITLKLEAPNLSCNSLLWSPDDWLSDGENGAITKGMDGGCRGNRTLDMERTKVQEDGMVSVDSIRKGKACSYWDTRMRRTL